MNKFTIKNYLHKIEITGDTRYEAHTIHSKNIFARYAHKNRIKRCIEYVMPFIDMGKVLDYGCGTGLFVSICNQIKSNSALGYEPFMQERYEIGAPVYSNWDDIIKHAPYKTITCFEVIEHLSHQKIENFLSRCNELLSGWGEGTTLIFSAPIEIGPVLFLKEIHRILGERKIEYGLFEFVKAAIFAMPGKRIPNTGANNYDGYGSHKGFDFRETIRILEQKGYKITVLGYGPLPIKTWYGNSQVFF
jgi:hypothetical protein